MNTNIKNSISKILFPASLFFISMSLLSFANENDHKLEDEHEHHDEHSDFSRITEDMAFQVGIKTAIAGPGTIRQTLTAYGRLYTASEQMSHIRARFPGLIAMVQAKIGDAVSAGDLLAKVESNESLKTYDIRAPISGLITERHANEGEFTGEQTLFTIASFETLWVELKIFPAHQAKIHAGQQVIFEYEGERFMLEINHLIPAQDAQPFVLARASVNNETGRLTPGSMIEAEIVINEMKVPLVIKNSALQILDQQTGIFIKNKDVYSHASVEIGLADDEHSEIISGLDAGTEYVVENAYLIRADIEKSKAEHQH